MTSRSLKAMDWTERGVTLLRAAIIVACYLIVFAGLLYTVAGGAMP